MIEFLKVATAYRRFPGTGVKYVFVDFDEKETLSLRDLYEGGVEIASWMLEQNLTRKATAIIGRFNKFSSSAFVSRKYF